jgi:hypothetical protein
VLDAALQHIDELCGNHETVGTLATKIVIEGYKPDHIQAIRRGIQDFLDERKLYITGTMVVEEPLVRRKPSPPVVPIPPEPTPMERMIEAAIQSTMAANGEVDDDFS